MKPLLKRSRRLLVKTVIGWIEDEAPRLSAALAFFTMLSLSPLVVIATSVAGLFYDDVTTQQELVRQVQSLTGPEGGKVVEQALGNAEFGSAKSLQSGIVAGVILLFTSTAVFVQLQSALNKIWDTQAEENNGNFWIHLLLIRGRSLALVLGIGFLLIVSLLADTLISILEQHLVDLWGEAGFIVNYGYSLLNLGLVTALFFLMFRFLPDRDVDGKAAWIGGLVTALLLATGKWGIGIYLGNSAVASAYGAAGSLVAFLLWVYYSMLVFFVGAEFTHVLSEDRIERY